MNTKQKKYTAFMESVCKEFNCPEMFPALNAGFKAFCEANDYYYGSNKYWYCDDPDDNNPETCIIPKGEKDLYKMVTTNVPEVNAELVPPGTAPYYKPFPKYRFTYNMDPSADGYRQNLDILSKMMQLGFRNISISNEAPYTAYFSYAQGTTDKYDQKSALESAKKIFNSWRMNRTDHPQTTLTEGIERLRKKKTGQYFKRNDTTGHTELYDTVLKALQSKYDVLESEDCDPNSNRFSSGVSVSVLLDSDPDSTPYDIDVYDYGYKHDLSYSIRDEYGNNLKDYISACRGAPLGGQKGYFDLNLLISDLMRDLGKLEYTPEDSGVNS